MEGQEKKKPLCEKVVHVVVISFGKKKRARRGNLNKMKKVDKERMHYKYLSSTGKMNYAVLQEGKCGCLRLISSDRSSTTVCSLKDDCDKREAVLDFFFTVLLTSSVIEGALELTMTSSISFSYRRFLPVLLITFSL